MDASDSISRQAKVRNLFEQLADKRADERATFLDEQCRDDPALKQDILLLLQNEQAAEARFAELEEGILGPALKSLRADPGKLKVWLDLQHDESSEASDSLIGQTVSHFEITSLLGRGGMGVVYQARDLRLDRKVALKFLPPALNTDAEARVRFIHEAQTASALEHPNIATIHEIDETDDHHWFIAMSFYPGVTLKEKIEQGALPVDIALSYAIQLARALSQAHQKDIVHRDIKPGNIMISDDGTVCLLDFGLAELANTAGQSGGGAMVGTIAYMSPEQVRGGPVDARSDIWSLGVVLYEMLTGVRPFAGENPSAVIENIQHADPLESAPSILINNRRAKSLRSVIETCLARDPAARFPDANALLERLERIRDRGLRRKVTAGLVGGVVTAILALGFLWGYRMLVPPPEPSGFIEVVEDPFALGQGKVLQVHPGEQGNEKIFRLVATLALPEKARIVADTEPSGPVTFYFKVGRPSIEGAPGKVDITWGLAAGAVRWSEGTFRYRDYSVVGGYRADGVMHVWVRSEFWQPVSDAPLATDTYYELWFVMNHPATTYDLHIRGGTEFPETTLAYSGAIYRKSTLEALDHFLLITSTGSASTVLKGKDPTYFDDLYLFPEGENLDRPGEGWILLDDFEDGDARDWEVDRTSI